MKLIAKLTLFWCAVVCGAIITYSVLTFCEIAEPIDKVEEIKSAWNKQ